MPSLMETLGIDKLPLEQRAQLADEILESLEGEPLPLTEEQIAELERRLKRADAGESRRFTMEEVFERLAARIKQ